MNQEANDEKITAAVALRKAFDWWEAKRLLFNLIVGSAGLTCILTFPMGFAFSSAVFAGSILYGILANICYGVGPMVEFWDAYYTGGKLKIGEFRQILFVVGTIFSVIITFYLWRAIIASFFWWD